MTGNDWPVGIGSASATVTVAGGGRSLTPRTRCFTGPRGSREEACRISRLDMGATFQSKREFRAGAFRPTSFHHSLDSALSTLSGAMKAAPRSSGSGFPGGGSSGGGGGGGGGGSW